MTIKVTVEGGGSFELNDEEVSALRKERWVPSLVGKLSAALPPEPYQPKEGDRVQYRLAEFPPGRWTQWAHLYLGKWQDWHVVIPAPEDLPGADPDLIPASAEFRRVES